MTRYLLLLAAAVSAPAGAWTVEEVPQVSVPVWAIRLDSPRAVAALRQRIARAAETVCEPKMPPLSALSERRACREQASAKANAQLDRMISQQRPATAMLSNH
jgi:UrcA family protein